MSSQLLHPSAILPADMLSEAVADNTVVATKKSGPSSGIKTLIGFAVILMVLNGVLIHRVVTQYNETAPVIDDARMVFAAVKELMDYPDRLLHGSIVRAVNNLVQSDYGAISRNVTKLSQSIQDLFDTASDSGQLQVAQYSSLVTSVANKIGTLRPTFTPVERPSDDQGLVNMIAYLTQFAVTQVDRREMQSLASSCTIMLDSLLNVDWSGSYEWCNHRGYDSWQANSAKSTAAQVYQYCDRISRLPPNAELPTDDTNVDEDITVESVTAAATRLRKMMTAPIVSA